MKRLLTAILIAGSASAAMADGLKSLESFMKNAQAGKAEFTQSVTAPAKAGQEARTKVSSGTFEFQRPGKFKFNYTKPFEQVIVADGKTLWLYDVDLNQVTQRAQAQALGSTPAAILTSATDLKTLQADFGLSNQPASNGLDWVLASPKVKGGQLKEVRIGFSAEGQLAALDIEDSFGQRSVMQFKSMQTQASLPAATFHFTAPKGADVIKQ